MPTNRFENIDLSVALEALHKLELHEGDLGRDYWRHIAELLKETCSFRQRALLAEEKLRAAAAVARQSKTITTVLTLKERKRIAAEYSQDIARMQEVLLAARLDYLVDDMVCAWSLYSGEFNCMWMTLPLSDAELLLKLTASLGP